MTQTVPSCIVTSCAPGKVILFGEHSVNRGQLALAAAFGRRATCRLETRDDDCVILRGGGCESTRTLDELRAHAVALDTALAAHDFAVVAAALRNDFFASSAYVLGRVAAVGTSLSGLTVAFESDIPIGGGLGSGGGIHAALAMALARLVGGHDSVASDAAQIGEWAYAGDRIAHGGTASALDTQTSLLGGVIEFRAGSPGAPLTLAPGLRLVVGDTGIKKGSTGSVNARVRDGLAADPARFAHFQAMGFLATAARDHLRVGRWAELGALMDENHRLLSLVGASHPQLDALCSAARAAGALGAKLTGAGGGGAMIALVADRTAASVAAAIRAAGGTPIEAPIACAGAAVESFSQR